MPPRWETARFHVLTGPDTLFERVRQVMGQPTLLKTHAGHTQDRHAERNAPMAQLARFDPAEWQLVSAEVRTDSGKWVTSTWRVDIEDQSWWVVVGMRDTIITVIDVPPDRLGLGMKIVKDGPVYELVEEVNSALVAAAKLKS